VIGLSLFQRLATPAEGAIGPQEWVDPWGLYRWLVRPSGGGEALGSETAKVLDHARRRAQARFRGMKIEPKEGEKPKEAEARQRAALLAEEVAKGGAELANIEAPRPGLVAQMVVAGVAGAVSGEAIDCSRQDVLEVLSSDLVIEAGYPYSGQLLGPTLCRLLCDESLRLANELGLAKETVLGNWLGSSNTPSGLGTGRADSSDPTNEPSSPAKKRRGSRRAKP
jgi:hypothetical protein